jgi:hypothetical protein
VTGRASALLLLAASASCSLINDPGSIAAESAVEVGAFCIDFADRTCQAQEDCCAVGTPDFDRCVTQVRDRCSLLAGSLAARPETGYDGVQANAVLAEIDAFAASCDPAVVPWTFARSGFYRLFQGSIELGQACSLEGSELEQFAAALSCLGDDNTCLVNGARADCAARSSAEGPCATDFDCVDGHFCQRPDVGGRGICRIQQADDALCRPGANSSCASFFCNPTVGDVTGRCVTPPAEQLYCLLGSVVLQLDATD